MAVTIDQCKKCKKQIYGKDMHIDKDGKSIICRECYGSQEKIKHSVPKKTPSTLEQLGIEIVKDNIFPGPKGPEALILYKCERCNYEFSRKASSKFNMLCPYCGRDSVKLIIREDAF